jgi:NitT/TauT family transport system substrate-binding protein
MKLFNQSFRFHVLSFLILSFVLVLAGCGGTQSPSNTTKSEGASTKKSADTKVVIAEPVHNLGYLPLYVAIDQGYFEGIDVSVTTLAGGGAHTNAVLTDQAWGFIGGPEHNAFAKAKGAELRAIINVVNRGNVYITAANGEKLPSGDNLAEYFKGKKIATGFYGGTPNSITRYYLAELGLDVEKDVTLLEVDNAAMTSIIEKDQASIAVISEPILTQGIEAGIWTEPIVNVPEDLGAYAYSTINIKQDTIKNNPESVKAFVAGLKKGLQYVKDNPKGSYEIARKEFSTMDTDVLKKTLDRSYADGLWEFSGEVTEESVETNLSVVKNAGLLKEDITYDQIVDMSFVKP